LKGQKEWNISELLYSLYKQREEQQLEVSSHVFVSSRPEEEPMEEEEPL